MSDSIFSKIINREIPSNILFEDQEFIVIRDIHPKAPTHILIIPRRHIPKITDLQESDEKLVGRMVTVANILAEKEGLKESGFRLIFNCGRDSGQEVFHIHLHLLGGRPFHWPPG